MMAFCRSCIFVDIALEFLILLGGRPTESFGMGNMLFS